MILSIILLLVGLTLLTYGSNFLIEGSSTLARKYGISELVIGLVVIGFGTSLPELLVNIIASVKGDANGIVLGNVIGSNNFNLLFILGITGLIAPLKVQGSTIWKEIPISLLAAVMIILLANDNFMQISETNVIGRIDGIILIILFIAFLFYVSTIIKNDQHREQEIENTYSGAKMILFITGGLLALLIGGKIMVDNAVNIANYLGIDDKIIGLTIVSAGTSLPELAATISAARKGKADLAVGNIIGSNIFNIFLILGASAIIRPINFDTTFNIDISILIIATILLFIAMFTGQKGKLDRWEAILLILGLIAYLSYTFLSVN
jgi:cation:H+ antiporter